MRSADPLSILLLEDQGLVRAGMRALIQVCEPLAAIQECSSFDEAVERASNHHFDIAFLDIDLKTEKSGLDVLRHLRSHDEDTRVVMLSGRSEREVVMECIGAGASGFILKDMENDGVFRRALDTIFQGSIFLPANVIGRGAFSPTAASRPGSIEGLGLSGRSLEALYYLCQGLPNKTIARRMGIEEGTIRKDYVPKLFRAFKVLRRTELVVEVARRGLVIPRPPQEADRPH
ncbi:response regulator transcription factor [Bradyrhizobium sp. AUGA SZCCT0431]|uniref:response regulator n=1 Tax=Bradyrhizobium sp. AUGA SZCCT0431 TaxID=2807674 RepID=UPI001BA57F13|nr:response regulator transcription factor [Bradyrhizobium sp. AUGA SZCCT0431]MBR1147505.1 response regulator transcription factor [Bradyrhizobium sp. AUGA SZCCT0431]